MKERRAESGFIVRVIRDGRQQQIVVHDLRSGKSLVFTSWIQAAEKLRSLSEEARPMIH